MGGYARSSLGRQESTCEPCARGQALESALSCPGANPEWPIRSDSRLAPGQWRQDPESSCPCQPRPQHCWSRSPGWGICRADPATRPWGAAEVLPLHPGALGKTLHWGEHCTGGDTLHGGGDTAPGGTHCTGEGDTALGRGTLHRGGHCTGGTQYSPSQRPFTPCGLAQPSTAQPPCS